MNCCGWQRLGDIATIDKVRFTGPPPRKIDQPPPPAGSNNVIVSALTFFPRTTFLAKRPWIVFVTARFTGTWQVTRRRMLCVRCCIRLCRDCPGLPSSSGYGRDFWRQIDYGGLEIEDVQAARA